MLMCPGKIFVGGLSHSTTEDHLYHYFATWGSVARVVIMREKKTGESKKYGFVTFATRDSVDPCLEQGPHVVNGALLTTNRAQARDHDGSIPEYRTSEIFIGGIPPRTKEAELVNYFSEWGPVANVRVKDGKGFAFVNYEHYDYVDFLMSIRPKEHEAFGRTISVDRAKASKNVQAAESKDQSSQPQQSNVTRLTGRVHVPGQARVDMEQGIWCRFWFISAYQLVVGAFLAIKFAYMLINPFMSITPKPADSLGSFFADPYATYEPQQESYLSDLFEDNGYYSSAALLHCSCSHDMEPAYGPCHVHPPRHMNHHVHHPGLLGHPYPQSAPSNRYPAGLFPTPSRHMRPPNAAGRPPAGRPPRPPAGFNHGRPQGSAPTVTANIGQGFRSRSGSLQQPPRYRPY